jgi:EAL domain-containing protein (putative c-di-GMP-specific phosphodiesterase class I)/ActR/RegA family two-component response regulator
MGTNKAAAGRVLVVDDEPALVTIYSEHLGAAGYDVVGAGNGREAIEVFHTGGFEAVVTDIRMPDLDGMGLLRALRKVDLDVPVILVTGAPGLDTAVEAVSRGAFGYFMKPLTERVLCDTVARAVRLYRVALLKRQALLHLGDRQHLVGDRAGLEVHFESALRSLWLAYQPVFQAADGSMFAREALLRTAEPALPDPSAMLAAAERLGRHQDLGREVRDQAAASLAAGPPGTVFVNLHPRDLLDENLYSSDSPLGKLASTVVLEVTERDTLDAVPDVPDRVRELRKLGYRIAVDDLGAGYAGLSSFTLLEPDLVKLDMSLIRDLDTQPVKQRVVGSISSLCRDLGVLVVAEGIETERERAAVVDHGCDLLQGFLLGRPAALP